MTPKEKATELYYKYAMFWHYTTDTCKKQCLIAVDEIIKEHYPQDAKRCEYWNQVKTEIEKL